ncbi:hypothetical protein Bbelb_244090 [Branchiostoma belcheri]|nr:hypothetical protein Bbelb_244090 [Branchiostoma belcheri]
MPATGGVPLGVLTMRSRRLFVSGARFSDSSAHPASLGYPTFGGSGGTHPASLGYPTPSHVCVLYVWHPWPLHGKATSKNPRLNGYERSQSAGDCRHLTSRVGVCPAQLTTQTRWSAGRRERTPGRERVPLTKRLL